MKPFNQDGRTFIQSSAHDLSQQDERVDITPKTKRVSRSGSSPTVKPRKEYMHQPRIFNHYVMNLPATAITFLDAFIGLYRGREESFAPHTPTKLPMIHVYCFSNKSDDNVRAEREICEEISSRIGYTTQPGREEVTVWDVRDVAPKKRMFCASFRLPAEVAFRSDQV